MIKSSTIKITKDKKYIPKYVLLIISSIIILLPVIYTVTNSFMSSSEIQRYYQNIYTNDNSTMLHIIPDIFSLDAYYNVLLAKPNYLLKFWNSLIFTGVIVFGQVIISCIAGYGFAKFKFPLRDSIFFIIIILMMMPYQVTLVSNYIILDKIGLLGTWWAIILPGIFSPFGVFLMRQVISTMPDVLLEAGKIDGANQFILLFKIVIPRSKSGIISLIILSFIDNWNMVEQPLIFLKEQSQYPLSVFLSQINNSNQSLSFACGVLAMIPVVLLFLFYDKELAEGISFSNLK